MDLQQRVWCGSESLDIAHRETANLVKVCPLKFSPQPLMNMRNALRKTLRRDRIQVFLLRRDNYPKANLGMHPLIGGVNLDFSYF